MRRTIFCVTLLVLALAAAFVATRARRLGLRVESFAVEPGGSADNVPKLGDDLPFAPFRFAVVGPMIVGEHGAVGTAMDEIRRRGGADFVLVTGQLLESERADGAERLAAACRDRGMEVLAVPGVQEDAHGPPQCVSSRAAVERNVSPLKWSVRHRTWWFETEEHGALCDGRPYARVLAWRDGDAKKVSVADVPDMCYQGPAGGDIGVRIWGVDRDDSKALAMADEFWVPRGPTPASRWRDLALGTIYPLVRPTSGYVAFLAACAIVAALALTRLRPARPSASGEGHPNSPSADSHVR